MIGRAPGLTVAEGISGLSRGDPRLVEIDDCLEVLHCGAPPSEKEKASRRLKELLAALSAPSPVVPTLAQGDET